MIAIKSYSDLQQSKKLAEILSLESADMYYWLAWSGGVSEEKKNTPKVGTPNKDAIKTYWCPCWSLASLLEILKSHCGRLNIHLRADKKYNILAVSGDFVFRSFDDFPDGFDTTVDACYEMILKLHELNLL